MPKHADAPARQSGGARPAVAESERRVPSTRVVVNGRGCLGWSDLVWADSLQPTGSGSQWSGDRRAGLNDQLGDAAAQECIVSQECGDRVGHARSIGMCGAPRERRHPNE